MVTLRNLKYLVVCLVIASGTAALTKAQQTSSLTIVSGATFQPGIAPDSMATIFGQNLSRSVTSAQLDAAGSLPTIVDGTSVSMNGEAARLVYVSPTQINFIVPADTPVGFVGFSVTTPLSPTPIPGSTTVVLVSPGLFAIPCLRTDRGAVINGVTNSLEPFRALTTENPGDDKRTRLSIFGTGLRYAGNSTRNPNANVAGAVTVEAANPLGDVQNLTVEYAGASPSFAGLDQVNVVIPPSFEGAGLTKLRVRSGNTVSNWVSVVLSNTLPVELAPDPGYSILTVAGTGDAGNAGDQGRAVRAQLQNPTAVALDSQGNLYIASGVNHVVRRVSADGMIATFAGTGEAGSSGDGGPATQAQLRRPISLAIDSSGNVYIADADDHKVRRVAINGSISTFAGTGNKGFAGDGGPANASQLFSPSAIAMNRYGTLIIADTGNNRVRKVTADGLIFTVAGRGTPGSSGDGNSAFLAELNAPDSIAVGADGTIFVADEGNHRIRRIAPDGSIRTIVGGGDMDLSRLTTEAGQDIPGLSAMLQSPIRLALDDNQQIFISDSSNARIRTMDASCKLGPAAGTGVAGFSGDGGPATSAELNMPLGLAPASSGDVYFADSNNNRVRKLFHGNCSLPAAIIFDPPLAASGSRVNATVRLSCPTTSDATLLLNADRPGLQFPTSVTVTSGQDTAVFSLTTPIVTSMTGFQVTASNGQYNASGTLYVQPSNSGGSTMSLTLLPAVQFGGAPLTGTVILPAPAAAGGALVTLTSDTKGVAKVGASVLVPAGQRAAEFLVSTSSVTSNIVVTISGALDTQSASASATIIPGGATGTILSLSISPSSVNGGEGSTGTVTMTTAAPSGGVQVSLSSNNGAAEVPSSITVPGGQTTAIFSIGTVPVSTTTTATITATSANSASAGITVTPGSGGGGGQSGTILGLSISPSSVTGGQGATGTVTMGAPAPSGGVQVGLSSNNSVARVPSSVTVQAGQSSATFPVSTSTVSTPVTATITASSANTASASLTVNPASGGGGGQSGTILGLSITPSSVTDTQGATGTVTMGAPAPAGGVQVSLSSNSPVAGVPSAVTVQAGQSSATFPVATSTVTSSTTATVTASASNSASATITVNPASGGGGGQSGTILGLSITPPSVTGGQGATGTVTMGAAAPSGGVQVSLSSNSSAAGVPASVTIPPGQSSASFPVSTSTVTTSITATVTASASNTASATITVNPPAGGGGQSGTILGLSISPSSVTGGQGATGTVTMAAPAPAGGVQVSLSSNSSAAGVPSSVTVAAGQSSASFPVSTSTVSASTTATITASASNSASASLTVNPAAVPAPCVGSLVLSVGSIVGGNSLLGTVTLTSAARVGGEVVNLGSSSLSANVPASVMVAAGQSSASFSITTSPVVLLDTSIISASLAACANVTATLSITPLIHLP
jgi:uncharacterized protein (TIGR03437 family)